MARIESALRRLEGVQGVQMDYQSSRVVIRPTAKPGLDLSSLPDVVERASNLGMRYRVGWWKLVASGRLERSGTEVRFLIKGWPVSYPIEEENRGLEGSCVLEAEVIPAEDGLRLRITRVLRSRTEQKPASPQHDSIP